MTDSILQRAEILVQQKKYDDAEKLLRDLLIQNPNDVHVLLLLSEVKIQQNKPSEANQLINVAIGIEPSFGYLFYLKARISILLNEYDEATKNIKQAVESDPTDANFFALWASIKLSKKLFEQALELADKSLELDPENLLGLNIRSMALLKLDKKEDSYQTIEGALREDPNNPYTHTNYGWNLLEKGNHKKALEHFKEALKNDPSYEYAQAGMGEALKASNPLYRIFLKYAFFMGNLTEKYQWGVIIGFYLLSKLSSSLAKNIPALEPYLMPINILLAVIAFSTWVISPISNLFLRLNPYGKYLLNKKEIASSNYVGISLLVGLVSLVAYFVLGSDVYLALAVFGITMMVPLSTMFTPTTFKHALVIYTVVLGLIGLLAIFTIYYNNNAQNLFTSIYFIGFIGFQWVSNFVKIRENNV